VDGQGAEQEQGCGENASATHSIGGTVLHEFPLTRVPREF